MRWNANLKGTFTDVTPTPWGQTIPMEQRDPYIWLYAIDIPTDPRTKLRVTPYPETVEFERDSAGTTISWYPFSIGHADVSRDAEGKLPSVALIVQNVTLTMADFLRSHGGLIGESVRIALMHKPDLPDGTPIRDERYEIQNANVREGSVTLQLGQYSLYRLGFPNRRITRDYCGHAYGGAGCGYDTTRAGALASCDKTKDGTNGCTVHGTDEEGAGMENRHPDRMLVFEGVLRASGLGVK